MRCLRQSQYSFIKLLLSLLLTTQLAACNSQNIANAIANHEPLSSAYSPVAAGGTDINLSWTAPSEREDNQPISLAEIAGYKIHYGSSRRNYAGNVTIKNGSSNSYVFKSLGPGTYHFALTTYDTAGRESQYSEEITIVV